MSEVISRPSASRGRGSGRGGRGGFAGRGGRRTNGDHKPEESLGAFDDDGGDIGELRKQYGDKTSVIREMFPDWSEVDVLFALQETNGDQSEAVTRIAEGSISQWGEVSKPKKTSRAKAKDAAPVASSHESSSTGPRAARGGRTVSEGGRGRGRATERGGRSARGRSAAAPTNGARKENQALSIPTEESSAWGNDKPIDDAVEDKEALAEKPALTNEEAPKPAAPAVKTWASMLRQSAVPKAPPKPKEAPAPQAAPEPVEPEPTVEAVEPEPQPEPVAAEPAEESTPVVETATPSEPNVIEPEVALIPSKDELTETNLEQVVDDSQPPPTGTAASTAADSWDPRQNPASVATPLSAAQQQHLTQRPDTSGFAVAAAKATAERTVRTPTHHHHHQRRILDQEEAVRMPGNREVDRAAVQFGAFNLGDGEEDIDGDREEPETRAQPPADSPVAHPRASLPPVAQPTVPETFSQKATTTAPPTTSAGTASPFDIFRKDHANHVPASAAPAAPASQAPIPAQTAQPPASNQQQFGRFGQAGAQEAAAAPQKPLDPFNQQNTPSSQPPFDNFPTQTSQPQQPGGAFSSAPSDYSAYYTAAQQDRNPYSYYNQFGQQQGAQGQQESTPSQQRPFAAYGASQADNLSQYPQSGALHNQPRFGGSAGDAQNSGNSTPNPTTQAQQQQPQQPQQQQQGAQGSQPQSHGQQYPGGYNHPYYSNPYYQHYYSGYNQGGFGPYAGKGNVYGQPYGVSPNAPYDHTSSPAAFSQSSLHRDSGLGASGLGDYGRATSSQAGSQPGLGGSSFGGVHDSFARGASSFQGQGQSFNSQTQPGNAASSDELKPFGETKPASGPSPSIGGARPGSATNAPAAQSGLPPPGNSQMGGGYGGYPSHLQGHGLHGSNAYGMGGNAGASQHGNSAYGSYGQGFGGNSPYYGNQQQQQQRGGGGWGGNYH
ncbi:Fc.00g064880.m01.CDS01 [Cosmosporella sp. VM-42]